MRSFFSFFISKNQSWKKWTLKLLPFASFWPWVTPQLFNVKLKKNASTEFWLQAPLLAITKIVWLYVKNYLIADLLLFLKKFKHPTVNSLRFAKKLKRAIVVFRVKLSAQIFLVTLKVFAWYVSSFKLFQCVESYFFLMELLFIVIVILHNWLEFLVFFILFKDFWSVWFIRASLKKS